MSPYQRMDIARQLETETERNHESSLGVFKTTSGNMTKKLKAKQEKRIITRESKNKEASIKQIATKELQVEKF